MGTHPIFESDFDCLTVWVCWLKQDINKNGPTIHGEKKWSEDKNKISVKMMEKMGWTQGNGLGAKEDGRTEHVKIKFKDEKRGVGCSLKYDRQWIAHQDSFNDLLAGLNSGESTQSKPILADKAKINSLEKTGDKAGHRYRKFTKGKDLTNASSKHLEEIFGRS